MGTPWGYVDASLLVVASVASGLLVWSAMGRWRAAADSIERAKSEADLLVRQAQRDAENARKEAMLEAR